MNLLIIFILFAPFFLWAHPGHKTGPHPEDEKPKEQMAFLCLLPDSARPEDSLRGLRFWQSVATSKYRIEKILKPKKGKVHTRLLHKEANCFGFVVDQGKSGDFTEWLCNESFTTKTATRTKTLTLKNATIQSDGIDLIKDPGLRCGRLSDPVQ